jgi:LacI family transcriptional regulator
MIVQMKDVAERAGVSLTTASFVVNKKRWKSISLETAKRVWQAARELNYHVNVHARRLARGQSNLVGLIISEIANPFFPDVIRGFELAATQVKIVTGTSQHFATVSTAGSYLLSFVKR